MSEPGKGGIVELATESGVKKDLSHEHEQGNNGQVIGTEYRIKILDNDIERRCGCNQITKAQKTHEGHAEGHRKVQKQEGDEEDNADDADVYWIHYFALFVQTCRRLTRMARLRKKKQR